MQVTEFTPVSDSAGLGRGLGTRISNIFPGAVAGQDPHTEHRGGAQHSSAQF